MIGGIMRLRYHLTQILGHEMVICPKARPKIIQTTNKLLLDMGINTNKREVLRIELA